MCNVVLNHTAEVQNLTVYWLVSASEYLLCLTASHGTKLEDSIATVLTVPGRLSYATNKLGYLSIASFHYYCTTTSIFLPYMGR